jgi:hypothetical protein
MLDLRIAAIVILAYLAGMGTMVILAVVYGSDDRW